MTRHFTADEQIQAIDGVLAPARLRHLDECVACRSEVRTLEDASRQLCAAGHVPEPSPLFWDHLSARIQTATSVEPMPAPAPWWSGWRPLAAFGAAAAAVLLGVQLHLLPSSSVQPSSTPAIPDSANDDASWNAIARMTSSLSSDDVQLVMAPQRPEAPVTVVDLTPKERAEFVKLLGELGGSE